MSRIVDSFVRFFMRWVPDSFVIAVILSLLTFGLAIGAKKSGPAGLTGPWGTVQWGIGRRVSFVKIHTRPRALRFEAPTMTVQGMSYLSHLPNYTTEPLENKAIFKLFSFRHVHLFFRVPTCSRGGSRN